MSLKLLRSPSRASVAEQASNQTLLVVLRCASSCVHSTYLDCSLSEQDTRQESPAAEAARARLLLRYCMRRLLVVVALPCRKQGVHGQHELTLSQQDTVPVSWQAWHVQSQAHLLSSTAQAGRRGLRFCCRTECLVRGMVCMQPATAISSVRCLRIALQGCEVTG